MDKKQPGEKFLESFAEITRNLNLRLYEVSMVRDVVGISQNLLDQWIYRKIVKPTEKGSGPGTRNLYNELNMCQILLLKELNDVGFSLTKGSELAYQPKVEAFFAVALSRMREIIRLQSEGETGRYLTKIGDPDGLLEWDLKESLPWVTAVFSRKADGTDVADFLYEKEHFVDFFYKSQDYSVTTMFNLTHIAWRVNTKL
jgi:hypothetical protein